MSAAARRLAAVLPALAIGLGLAIQAGIAAWLADDGPQGTMGLLTWFGARLPAVAAVAWGAWRMLPADLRAPRRAMLGWLAAFEWMLPAIVPCLLAAIHVGLRLRVLAVQAPVATVREPEYSLYRRHEELTVARAGRLRTKLADPRVPADQRVSALLALQDVPAQVTADLLRGLLADPLDDIRLLAYGMLDGKEKAISQRLLAEEVTLASATGDEDRFGAHKRLAELQWELVYQRLVQGDMRKHACRESRKHAEAALALDGTDGGLWMLIARVGLVLDDMEAGRQALVMAEQHGIPRDLLVPWLAEYAFRERRFADVGRHFGELTRAPGALQLAASWRYWTGRPEPGPAWEAAR